jgi:hypothetical protein
MMVMSDGDDDDDDGDDDGDDGDDIDDDDDDCVISEFSIKAKFCVVCPCRYAMKYIKHPKPSRPSSFRLLLFDIAPLHFEISVNTKNQGRMKAS